MSHLDSLQMVEALILHWWVMGSSRQRLQCGIGIGSGIGICIAVSVPRRALMGIEDVLILESEGCHHLRLLKQWQSLSCASRTFPLCLC